MFTEIKEVRPGFFLTKQNKTNKLKHNAQQVENNQFVVQKIRIHGRRRKRTVESFSRQKLRQAPQKEGGMRNPMRPSSCVTPAGTSTSLTSRINGMTTHKHTHTKESIAYSAPLICIQVPRVLLPLFWCTYMAVNISAHINNNNVFLLDVILLTLCYYQRGTRLNAMKSFCPCSL